MGYSWGYWDLVEFDPGRTKRNSNASIIQNSFLQSLQTQFWTIASRQKPNCTCLVHPDAVGDVNRPCNSRAACSMALAARPSEAHFRV